MKLKLPPSSVVWILFSVFLFTNFLLAMPAIPLEAKLWAGLAGGITVLLLSQTGEPSRSLDQHSFYRREFLPAPSPVLWMVLAVLSVFLHFFKLTSLSTWPFSDDALVAFTSLHISQFWDWHFFYSHSQVPFPFYWGLALWFKFLGLSPATLWAFPALFSLLYMPLGYWAGRRYFSRSLSLCIAILSAVSFWALFAGRVEMSMVAAPAIELSVFYFLGRLLSGGEKIKQSSIFLGLALGLGFYFYPPSWIPFAAFLFATVVWICRKPAWAKTGALPGFMASFTTLVLPFVFFAIKENYGSYFRTLAPAGHQFSGIQQAVISGSYVSGLFWGYAGEAYYGSQWGGLFDPVTGSLVFTGLIRCWSARGDRLIQWLAAAFLLAMLPGMFSGNLEFFRVFLVFPLVLPLAAFGFQALSETLGPRQKKIFSAALISAIGLLNFYHLAGPYQKEWATPGPQWAFYKSPESFRAFQVLEQKNKSSGPGWIFLNLQPDMHDQSLALATFPFNGATHGEIASSKPRWFALLINVNYRPFLSRRFPGGEWVELSRDLNRLDGGLDLALFPIDSADRQTLEQWAAANSYFQEMAYHFLNRPTGTDYDGLISGLQKRHAIAQGDPLLESCFWEHLYYLYLQNKSFGDKKISANLQPCLDSIRSAIHEGYPASHLLNELGAYLMMMRKYPEAEKAFQIALQNNPQFVPAAENLQSLHRLKGTRP